MTEHLIHILNTVLFLFCLWAILDRQCKTKWSGTLVLSLIALASFSRLAQPECAGLLTSHVGVILNMAVALSVIRYGLRRQESSTNQSNGNKCTGENHAPD